MLAGDTPDSRPRPGLEDLLGAGNWRIRPQAPGAALPTRRSAVRSGATDRRVPAQERFVPRPHAGAPTLFTRSLRAPSGTARLSTGAGDFERPDRSGACSRKDRITRLLSRC